jgi:hypothetical protein
MRSGLPDSHRDGRPRAVPGNRDDASSRYGRAMKLEGWAADYAAYLHDLGYAPSLALTGLHALDGARHLRAIGHERLAGLVAYHSGARGEADLRGLTAELADFEDAASATSMALTYCDMTIGAGGEVVTLAERVLVNFLGGNWPNAGGPGPPRSPKRIMGWGRPAPAPRRRP